MMSRTFIQLNICLVFVAFALPAFAQDEARNETTQDEKQVTSTVEASEVNLSFMFDGSNPTSLEQLRLLESQARAAAERVKRATVNIRMGQAQGTGIIVSPDGYILTAAHVIGEPELTATVILADNRSLKAQSLGVNRRFDSGMLKIDGLYDLPYLEIGESNKLNLGQWVVAIGHPGGLDRDRGMVLRMGRLQWKSSSVLRTDCVLVGGDSGGPLVDMNGNLIGIHSRIGTNLWENLHVPIDVFSDEWDKLAAAEVVNETPSPYLGFDVVGQTTEIARVLEGKPAAEAGLKKGDVIRKIGEKRVSNIEDIKKAIETLKVGDEIIVVIDRDEKKDIEIKVRVGRAWR
jgi:serine protease Do